MEGKERNEYKQLTHEELVAEAIALIQRMNESQLREGIELALATMKGQ